MYILCSALYYAGDDVARAEPGSPLRGPVGRTSQGGMRSIKISTLPEGCVTTLTLSRQDSANISPPPGRTRYPRRIGTGLSASGQFLHFTWSI